MNLDPDASKVVHAVPNLLTPLAMVKLTVRLAASVTRSLHLDNLVLLQPPPMFYLNWEKTKNFSLKQWI